MIGWVWTSLMLFRRPILTGRPLFFCACEESLLTLSAKGAHFKLSHCTVACSFCSPAQGTTGSNNSSGFAASRWTGRSGDRVAVFAGLVALEDQ